MATTKKKMTKRQRRLKNKERMRRWRAKNPIKDSYANIKKRSVERGHTFGISLEYFTQWCIDTGYHLLKGKTGSSASIDRIRDEIGYEEGNLTILTLSQNSVKENMRRKGIDYYRGMNDIEPEPYVNDPWNPIDTDTQF